MNSITKNINENSTQQLYKWALWLSFITIGYNVIEGVVATWFGAHDETLALFGFGVDSFVEVISGLGIAHMILRMRRKEYTGVDEFEITALKITGTAFYILVAGLIVGASLAIYTGAEPRTTMVGIIISTLSILTMYALYYYKMKIGEVLDSGPIISDAKCTKTCFYLSFILLGSSLLYEVFAIPYVDAIGSLGIAYYAYKEGKEAFEKARTRKIACVDDCC